MELGERFARIRKEHNYTQKELAVLLNVSQQIVSNIERSTTLPDVKMLESMADIYGMSIDDLIGRKKVTKERNDIDNQIIDLIEKMDDTGKELSLSLVNQVAQHQGKNNAK